MNFKNIEANKNLKIFKYSLEIKKNGAQQSDWIKGVSELKDFQITKYPGTLLGGPRARVIFKYQNTNHLQIDGPVDDVLFASIAKIKEKKNPAKMAQMQQDFMTKWNAAKMELKEYQKGILSDFLENKNITASDLAKNTDQNRQSVYYQLQGKRAITYETAQKYAEKLNVDEADFFIPKKTTSVWGYVNTLQDIETDEYYAPGRVFPSANKERVIVPRDIYQANIRAIKINAEGSMYHNQVAFYYKDNQSNLEINNKLCVVGIRVKGFFDEELTHYYFGLLENYRGKKTLLNPDPYCEESKKIIYKDFDYEFISPVVTMIDPKAVKDATAVKGMLPSEVLVTEAEAERKLADLTMQYEFKVKDLKLKNQKDRETGARLLKEYEKSAEQLTKKQEEVKRLLAGEVTKAINDLYYEQQKLEEEKKRA